MLQKKKKKKKCWFFLNFHSSLTLEDQIDKMSSGKVASLRAGVRFHTADPKSNDNVSFKSRKRNIKKERDKITAVI